MVEIALRLILPSLPLGAVTLNCWWRQLSAWSHYFHIKLLLWHGFFVRGRSFKHTCTDRSILKPTGALQAEEVTDVVEMSERLKPGESNSNWYDKYILYFLNSVQYKIFRKNYSLCLKILSAYLTWSITSHMESISDNYELFRGFLVDQKSHNYINNN